MKKFKFPKIHLGAPSKYEKFFEQALRRESNIIRLPSRMEAKSCKQYLIRHGYIAQQSECMVRFSDKPFCKDHS